MNRYDNAVQDAPRTEFYVHTPFAVRIITISVGLALGSLILMWSTGFPAAELRLKVAGGIAGGVFVISALTYFVVDMRPLIHRAVMSAETKWNIDINRDGYKGEPDIRLIPTNTPRPTIAMNSSEVGIPDVDLEFMIDRLDYDNQTGWTVREWLGTALPTGYQIEDARDQYYVEFIKILVDNGWLTGRDERTKGKLLVDKAHILECLGL